MLTYRVLLVVSKHDVEVELCALVRSARHQHMLRPAAAAELGGLVGDALARQQLRERVRLAHGHRRQPVVTAHRVLAHGH